MMCSTFFPHPWDLLSSAATCTHITPSKAPYLFTDSLLLLLSPTIFIFFDILKQKDLPSPLLHLLFSDSVSKPHSYLITLSTGEIHVSWHLIALLFANTPDKEQEPQARSETQEAEKKILRQWHFSMDVTSVLSPSLILKESFVSALSCFQNLCRKFLKMLK